MYHLWSNGWRDVCNASNRQMEHLRSAMHFTHYTLSQTKSLARNCILIMRFSVIQSQWKTTEFHRRTTSSSTANTFMRVNAHNKTIASRQKLGSRSELSVRFGVFGNAHSATNTCKHVPIIVCIGLHWRG